MRKRINSVIFVPGELLEFAEKYRFQTTVLIVLTAILLIPMISSALPLVYGPQEDDGWTEDDYSNDEEVEDAYDDTPWAFEDGNDDEEGTDKLTENNDNNDNNDNDNDKGKITPYCDVDDSVPCHDRYDYSDTTGLSTCLDGSHEKDPLDCRNSYGKLECTKGHILDTKEDECVKKDSSNNNNDNTESGSSSSSSNTKTIIVNPSSASATANSADISSCKLDGSADGILQKFDSIKYQACGLYANGQKAYSDGFVMGCTKVGNTGQICQAFADSSILNANIQATQILKQAAVATEDNYDSKSLTADKIEEIKMNTPFYCSYEKPMNGCPDVPFR